MRAKRCIQKKDSEMECAINVTLIFAGQKKQFKNTEYSIEYIKSEALCKKELKFHTKNPKCKLPCRYYCINQIKASYKSQQKPQKKRRKKKLYKVIEG